MLTATSRGLSGRARKVHYRSRADREFAQQLIDDYYEPERHNGHRDHCVPIRGRSVFLPSVVSMIPGEGRHVETQLELPLTGGDDDGRPYETSTTASSSKGDVAAAVVLEFRPEAAPAGERKPLGPAQCRGDAASVAVPKRPAMTLRGFLVGCILGGSAAAALLLILRIML